MDKQKYSWTIDCEKPIGPISSYSLALWGIRGLLYPNDLIVDQNRTRYRAGFMASLQDIMRNTRETKKPKMWAIAGRKGGVGKSVLCSLMGIALSKLNKKVIIVDANFGCSIQSYNFGIEKSLRTFYESVHDDKEMAHFACTTPYPNLSVIAYKNGTCGPAAASIITKMKFIRSLKNLDADYILLDLGSRIDDSGLDYFLNCDKNIIVTTP
ncbi:AAA family ATPase, partial [candidate division KSB1 bacterium]|nr:AAA family ATPase [candidate division KSB1 bacterium]